MIRKPLYHSILAGACALALAGAAMAQARNFDIAQGDLKTALDDYARQSGLQVIYRLDDLRDARTQGARGALSAEDALGRILAGTGLAVVRSANGAIAIVRSDAAPRRPGAQAAPQQAPADQQPTREPAPQPQDAQAGASGNATELDTIVVTGTRIRAGDPVASPVYTLDREDFVAMGANSVQQVLRTLPQNFTGGSSETSAAVFSTRNGADSNVALGAGVNLRGLGTESTLVLLNGRRMAPGGFGNMTDVSTIPLSAIERVDVMPDGASAIYGSDAVGGVVNFVLREDFEGAETRFRYGTVTDGGLRQTSVSQVLGTAWATGSVLLNLDYGRNEPLLASERPFATGLQVGETDLSPADERIGFLVNGRQELTPDFTLSAIAYGVERDALGRSFNPFDGRQNTFDGTTTQFGGTLALDWRLNESWTATLAHTRGRSKNERQTTLGETDTLPGFETFVTATHDFGATELEMEGALFALPGGDARLAFGAEHRTEDLSINQTGGFASLSYQREVAAGYAELYLPLIGKANATAFAHRLSLTLAGRYEDYDDVGSADTYKIGALWSPIEHLNLRTTYGTSFRAPYLHQYDASVSAAAIYDLPNPAASSGFTRTAIILQMPDSNLGPENATIWSAGFDVAPELLGVRLSGTYFNIAYEDRIRTPWFDFFAFTDPSIAPLIAMPPDPELMDLIDEVVQFYNDTPGDLSTVEATLDARTRNQASTKMTGVDLVIGREFETDAGIFDLGLSVTKLLSHDVQPVAGAPVVDILDTIFNPVDLRARASLTWQSGGWSASAFVNYTDAYDDNQSPDSVQKVASWTTVDLGMGYTFQNRTSWLNGTTIQFNVINAFDRDPPPIADVGFSFGDPGYDTENANPIGRLIAVELSKTW